MIYFNGFSLKNEELLFDTYLSNNDTTVVGFSYGAQKAFDYVYANETRIDRLILLSPAFFQTHKASFIRTQLHYFEAGQTAYIKQFLSNVIYPSDIVLIDHLSLGTKEELSNLLHYQWDKDKIQEVLNRGTTIEVFLGDKDKIIDYAEVKSFFDQTITYTIKGAGHLLRGKV